MKEVETIYYRLVAEALDVQPEQGLAGAVTRVRERLAGKLDAAVMTRLPVDIPPEAFSLQGVVNPRLFTGELAKQFYLFLADARGGRYLDLLELLETLRGTFSHYVVYGYHDVVLRVHGTREEAHSVYETLTRRRYEPISLPVVDVPIYRGKIVPAVTHPSSADDLTNLRELQKDYFSANVEAQTKQVLKEKGFLLGAVALEDTQLTGRIRALVGIKFWRTPTAALLRDFPRRISTIETESKWLRTLFQCSGEFAYFAEVTVSDLALLDRLTDQIQDLEKGTIDTRTYIAAKRVENLLDLSKVSSPLLPELVYGGPVNRAVETLAMEFPDLRTELLKLSPEQVHLLGLFGRVVQQGKEFPPVYGEKFQTGFRSFRRAVVSKDPEGLATALTEVGRHVETILGDGVVKLIETFYGTNRRALARAQKDFHFSSSDIKNERGGFGMWTEKLEFWRTHWWTSALFPIPEEIIKELSNLRKLRDDATHRRADDLVQGDFLRGALRIEAALHDGLHAALWISNSILMNPDLKLVNVDTISHLLAKEEDETRWQEIFDVLLVNQRMIIRLISGIDAKLEGFLSSLAETKDPRVLSSVTAALLSLRRDILEAISQEKRTIFDNLFLRVSKATITLAGNVLANLIATLIINASDVEWSPLLDALRKEPQ